MSLHRSGSLRSSTLGWLILLGVWTLATSTRVVDPLFVASPLATAEAFVQEVINGNLLRAASVTTGLAAAGFLIGVLCGVPLGLALGGMPWFSKTFGGVIDSIRSVPSAALFPVFLLFFGVGRESKVAVAAFVCTLALCIYTASAVPKVNSTRRFLLRFHCLPWHRRFIDGLFFPALTGVAGGMRSAVSMALVSTVANEMIIGTDVGMGRYIYDAQMTFRIPQMYAAIVMAGLIGVAMNLALAGTMRKVIRWRQFDELG